MLRLFKAKAPNFLYTLDKEMNKQSILFLEILNNKELRYFSSDQDNDNLLALSQERSLEEQLEELSKWLTNKQCEVKAMFQPICFSLVPQALFEASSAPHYLDLIHDKLENSFVSYESLNNSSIELVYALDKALVNLVERKLNHVSITSRHKNLIEWLTKESKVLDSNNLWLLVDDKEILLGMCKEGQLQFFNTFKTDSWQDQLYYCLALCEQSNIDPKKTSLNLLGKNASDELRKNLEKQFYNIKNYKSLTDKNSVGFSSIIIESSYLCA